MSLSFRVCYFYFLPTYSYKIIFRAFLENILLLVGFNKGSYLQPPSLTQHDSSNKNAIVLKVLCKIIIEPAT